MYAPVPDGYTAVNMGYDGGTNALYLSSDMWLSDGTVVGILSWYPNVRGYDSASAVVRSFMVHGAGAQIADVNFQSAHSRPPEDGRGLLSDAD